MHLRDCFENEDFLFLDIQNLGQKFYATLSILNLSLIHEHRRLSLIELATSLE